MAIYRPKVSGSDGKKRKLAVWWVDFYDGSKRVRRSLKVRDRKAAEEAARSIVKRAERTRTGALDAIEEQGGRPILDHIAEFERVLSGSEVTRRHVTDRVTCLRAFVTATGARLLRDLDEPTAADWIKGVAGEQTRLGGTRSARDVNRRIRALRQFARWLVETRRVPFTPLPTLKPRNEGADRRHVRRALTPDEASRLLLAAASRPLAREVGRRVRKALPDRKRAALVALGQERALLYATALYTALRRGELAALRWADLDLDKRTLRVVASTAKGRRERWADLRPDLSTALLGLRKSRGDDVPSTAHVFRPEAFPTAHGFALDLLAAGIAREVKREETTTAAGSRRRRNVIATNAREQTVDFHALRVTAVTWAQGIAGASAREAQAIAGHARPEITLQTYTDPSLLDVRGVYERLPSIGLATIGEASTMTVSVTGGSPNVASARRSLPKGRGKARKSGAPAAARIPANPGDSREVENGAGTWT